MVFNKTICAISKTKQFNDVHKILYKRVLDLLYKAIELDVPITIDEEQNRLSLTSLFERVLNDQKLQVFGTVLALQFKPMEKEFLSLDFFDAQTANRAQTS